MAVQLPIPVRFEDVFPAGAYVLGVEPVIMWTLPRSQWSQPV